MSKKQVPKRCQECDLKAENDVLHENIAISDGFSRMNGVSLTKFRAALRAWGAKNSADEEFYDILGEETLAEKSLRKWVEWKKSTEGFET